MILRMPPQPNIRLRAVKVNRKLHIDKTQMAGIILHQISREDIAMHESGTLKCRFDRKCIFRETRCNLLRNASIK